MEPEPYETSDIIIQIDRYADEGRTVYEVYKVTTIGKERDVELLGTGETLHTALLNTASDIYEELTADAVYS